VVIAAAVEVVQRAVGARHFDKAHRYIHVLQGVPQPDCAN
jgi:hypothetical protein